MQTADNGLREKAKFGGIMTKVLNKTLLEHHIDNLKTQGITEILLVTPEHLPTSYSDGKRWGVELDIAPELHPSRIETGQEYLIIPANFLVDFRPDTDQKKFVKNTKSLDWRAIPSIQNDFTPVRLDLGRVLEQEERRSSLTARQLVNLIERLEDVTINRYIHVNVISVDDYGSLWDTTQRLLNRDLSRDKLAGYPLMDGTWGDVDTRVHESCIANGFVHIGRSSRIHKNVEFKGLVVIGDHVVIDEGSVLENTIVTDNTYVGKQLTLQDTVVDQKILYRTDLDAAMFVEDDFLLNSTV